MDRKLNREERSNLAHAISHLEANPIDMDGSDGWYYGNRKQFVERHRRAVKMLREWLCNSDCRRAKEVENG